MHTRWRDDTDLQCAMTASLWLMYIVINLSGIRWVYQHVLRLPEGNRPSLKSGHEKALLEEIAKSVCEAQQIQEAWEPTTQAGRSQQIWRITSTEKRPPQRIELTSSMLWASLNPWLEFEDYSCRYGMSICLTVRLYSPIILLVESDEGLSAPTVSTQTSLPRLYPVVRVLCNCRAINARSWGYRIFEISQDQTRGSQYGRE